MDKHKVHVWFVLSPVAPLRTLFAQSDMQGLKGSFEEISTS